MVIEGAVDIGNKHQHEIDSSNSNLPEGESTGEYTPLSKITILHFSGTNYIIMYVFQIW